MSKPVIRQRPSIDLDEFERRMHHHSANEDGPLAELARLVGETPDPYRDVFAQEADAHRGYDAPGYGQADARGRREPGFAGAGGSPRLFGDFAAIEAGLRGSVAPEAHDAYRADPYPAGPYGSDAPGAADAAYGDPQYGYEPDNYGHSAQGWDEAAHYGNAPEQKPASKRPMYLMAATIAVGVIGIGAAFALKGHVSSSPREIKTIMADAGPTKVAPPPEASGDAGAMQDPNLIGKSTALPTSLVNREEQPVDLTQAVQDNVARAAQMNPATMPTSVTDASTVPVPPSPRQMRTAMADPQGSGRADAIGNEVRGFGLSDMPSPKRVKVVSVRPDGTILPNDRPPAAAMPLPHPGAAKAADKAGPVAKASTPKAAAAKTTSRVTATPKSIGDLATADDASAGDAKPAKKTKPQRVASAEPTETAATEAATGSEKGGFAVQLAAPGSEADAKATSTRLSKTYAEALGSFHLGFHKAESNGKAVYRVRVSSLSRTEAVSLCEKLKAKGGSCFVAKN